MMYHMALEELLEQWDIDNTQDNLDHLAVLLAALKLYNDRGKVYGDTWRTYGALNNLLRAATKVDRAMEVWWHGKDDNPLLHKDNLDDAVDAINYLAFFLRGVREGNLTGSKRTRPMDDMAS